MGAPYYSGTLPNTMGAPYYKSPVPNAAVPNAANAAQRKEKDMLRVGITEVDIAFEDKERAKENCIKVM